jgi:hypothetical protein
MKALGSSTLKLTDLSPRVRAAILEAEPTNRADMDLWIHRPIPALRGRSVVGVLSEPGPDGELEVVALCRAIRGGSR